MTDAATFSGSVPNRPQLDPFWDEPAPAPERRQEPRYTLLIRTAKVVGSHGEWLCIIRDASAEAIRLKTFNPLPDDSEFHIELANGERHAMVKEWTEGDLVGFRFVNPVDIARLVAQAPPHLRKREITINYTLPLVVSAQAGECDAQFHDISQHGARIECPLHLALGERVRLDSDTLPAMGAMVRWRRAPFYGLLFDRAFAFDELARLCGVTAPPSEAAEVRAKQASF